MLTIKSIPQCDHRVKEFNIDLWEGLIQRIRQILITNSSENKINWNVKIDNPLPNQKWIKSLGNILYIRGDKVYELDRTFEQEYFGLPHLYTKKFKAVNLTSFRDSHRLFGHEKSIAVLSNNQSFIPVLERTLRKATMMFMEGAYLHHYEKFGVSKDMLNEAFINCE